MNRDHTLPPTRGSRGTPANDWGDRL